MPTHKHDGVLETEDDVDNLGNLSSPTALGSCCICERIDPTVRTIITLPKRSPSPGKGWGCLACGLPTDGALAVICDVCAGPVDEVGCNLDSTVPERLRFACRGYPGADGRVPIGELDPTPFVHDLSFHREEIAELGGQATGPQGHPVRARSAATPSPTPLIWTDNARASFAERELAAAKLFIRVGPNSERIWVRDALLRSWFAQGYYVDIALRTLVEPYELIDSLRLTHAGATLEEAKTEATRWAELLALRLEVPHDAGH